MKTFAFALLSLAAVSLHGDPWTDAFSIEKIANPPGLDPQIGGLAALPDGRVAACFHRGDVMIYDPAAKVWTRFASGLQEPLGLVVESPTSFLVMQRSELTRLEDTDGDGQADRYRTVFDGFGMTGNYHEFAFGPARGPDGSLYIGLNLASNGASIRPEIRGDWTDVGELTQAQMADPAGWKKYAGKAGRMYSRVAWRGWILKLSPDGSKMEPFASGFRSPDGLGFDAAGRLLVTDNQGDWRGTSPLYHVQKGGFYGHPASLVWTQGWTKGDPLKLPVAELDKLRTPESFQFAQGELANSPTQPIPFPPNTFGPLAGETLIGEMNVGRLVRFLEDPVDGFLQGAGVAFMETKALGAGNHRFAFTPDGALWVGKTHLSWAGSDGLIRIVPTGKPFLALTAVKARPDGFKLTFSQPLAPASVPAKVPLVQFHYLYHATYGSPKVDETPVVATPRLSADGLTLDVTTPALMQGRLYSFDLNGIRSTSELPLLGTKPYYLVSKLPK